LNTAIKWFGQKILNYYQMNVSSKFIGGLVFGTAIGIVTGLLMAPNSGNQTRKNIVKKSRVYSQQAVDAVRQYLETLKNAKSKQGESIYNSSQELLERLKQESGSST